MDLAGLRALRRCSGAAVRVRYAPSPTGSLHLGGLRTALINYLWARKNGGAFVLRIEDTDQKRLVPGAAAGVLRALRAVGLRPDEDLEVGGAYGPYVQSERTALYRGFASELVESGAAYPCFCSEARLELLRRTRGLHHGYDRHCRTLAREEARARVAAGEPHTIRMLVPEGVTRFSDRVFGTVSIDNAELDDQVLMKEDGFPTYHLASVVDDHLMAISDVIRGEDWLSSTPKQLLLYRALGWAPPTFCHLPLLLNANKSKMSKRQGDQSVESYLASGFLPEAIVNYAALVGFTPRLLRAAPLRLDELVEAFDFGLLHRGAPVLDAMQLSHINREWLRLYFMSRDSARLLEIFGPHLDRSRSAEENLKYVYACEDKIHRTTEIPEFLACFYERPSAASQRALLAAHPGFERVGHALQAAGAELRRPEGFDSFVSACCSELSLDKREVQTVVRLLLTGRVKGVVAPLCLPRVAQGLHQLLASLPEGEVGARVSQALSPWLWRLATHPPKRTGRDGRGGRDAPRQREREQERFSRPDQARPRRSRRLQPRRRGRSPPGPRPTGAQKRGRERRGDAPVCTRPPEAESRRSCRHP